MPTSSESYALAQAFREEEERLGDEYKDQFLALWAIWVTAQSSDDRRRWLTLNVDLIRRFRARSVASGRRYFLSARENDTGDPRTVPAGEPVHLDDDAKILRNLLDRSAGVYRRARLVGLDDLEAIEKARDAAASSGARMVLSGGRKTVDQLSADDVAVLGWMRVPDADPCFWCSMLVSRGAVYRSADAAGREVNDRFVGDGMFKFHDNCDCTAMPVFSRTDFMSAEAAKLREIWNKTYGTKGKTHSGHTVTGVAHFRAVLEGRAPLPT